MARYRAPAAQLASLGMTYHITLAALTDSLIFLSLSGVILWWETNRRRRLGLTLFGIAVATTLGLALWPMQS